MRLAEEQARKSRRVWILGSLEGGNDEEREEKKRKTRFRCRHFFIITRLSHVCSNDKIIVASKVGKRAPGGKGGKGGGGGSGVVI